MSTTVPVSPSCFREVVNNNNKRLEVEVAAEARVLEECQRLIAAGQEDAFVVLDVDTVKHQLVRWKRNLPRVAPWYAIKCHPDQQIMQVLFDGGCGFDAASVAEMQSALELGTKPENIIFANPCKQPSHIRFAENVGVRMMTFDNIEEMRKIKKSHRTAQLVMRILGDDSSSICKFNAKFGISVDECLPLVREAMRLGMDIVGVSFHVGSGCRSADAFVGALENARRAFDLLKRFGFKPSILDLGGGWPGSRAGEEEVGEIGFEEIADKVGPALDRLFPEEGETVKVIAEPGRYFAHACAWAVCSVTSKRPNYADMPVMVDAISGDDDTDHETSDAETDAEANIVGFRYYVNDGVYSTFNAVICDHRDNVQPSYFLNDSGKPVASEAKYECTIWGSTCDGLDKIASDVMLPNVPLGYWFVFKNMGAYTTSAASAGFNGFAVAKKFYVHT